MQRYYSYSTIQFILFLFLFSCQSNSYKLVVAIPNADNLQTPCTAYLNGLDVGVLENLRLGNQGQLYGDLVFTKINSLPSDSEFLITTQLLGGKSFQIKSGTSITILVHGDTVICQEVKTNSIKAGVANPLEDFMKIPQKQDSILKELQRLNQNIEKVLKEKKTK
ncbi:MAG: hypothetical protein HYZ44_07985 [Bacteroidetes bacterium]|nr:hypothetical protein [Bacteroidota bacterium]